MHWQLFAAVVFALSSLCTNVPSNSLAGPDDTTVHIVTQFEGGNRAPGILVGIREPASGRMVTGITDDLGNAIWDLPPGDYQVGAQNPDGSLQIRDVVLTGEIPTVFVYFTIPGAPS